MPVTTHPYPVSVTWSGGREGRGEVVGQHSGTRVAVAVPPEMQGPGGASNPEELLTSAIAACYTMTFGIIAQNRKLPVTDVRVEATGEVEQNGPSYAFTAVTIRPTITLSAEATEDQARMTEEMAHKADLYCIVTNAVRGKVAITVEPSVVKG